MIGGGMDSILKALDTARIEIICGDCGRNLDCDVVMKRTSSNPIFSIAPCVKCIEDAVQRGAEEKP